jgi:hypothetical protein
MILKGKRVIITIETSIEDAEDMGAYIDTGFNNQTYVALKYANGYTLELPRYEVQGTKIKVEEPKADDVDDDTGSIEE